MRLSGRLYQRKIRNEELESAAVQINCVQSIRLVGSSMMISTNGNMPSLIGSGEVYPASNATHPFHLDPLVKHTQLLPVR